MFSGFFFENRALYEKMLKNIVEGGRPQMTIWLMHFTCWIPKATDTHPQFVILIAFPIQQWLLLNKRGGGKPVRIPGPGNPERGIGASGA
jgi:hypothetical protein